MGIILRLLKRVEKLKIKARERVKDKPALNVSGLKGKILLLTILTFLWDCLKWFFFFVISTMFGLFIALGVIVAVIVITVYGILQLDFGDTEDKGIYVPAEDRGHISISVDELIAQNFPEAYNNSTDKYLQDMYRLCHIYSSIGDEVYGSGYTSCADSVKELNKTMKKDLLYTRIGSIGIESPNAAANFPSNLFRERLDDASVASGGIFEPKARLYGLESQLLGLPFNHLVASVPDDSHYFSTEFRDKFIAEYSDGNPDEMLQKYIPYSTALAMHVFTRKLQLKGKEIEKKVNNYADKFGFVESRDRFRSVLYSILLYNAWGSWNDEEVDKTALMTALMWYASSDNDANRSLDNWHLDFSNMEGSLWSQKANIWNYNGVFSTGTNDAEGTRLGNLKIGDKTLTANSCLPQYLKGVLNNTTILDSQKKAYSVMLDSVMVNKISEPSKRVYGGIFSYLAGKEIISQFSTGVGSLSTLNPIYGKSTVSNLMQWALSAWGHVVYQSGGGYFGYEDKGLEQIKACDASLRYALAQGKRIGTKDNRQKGTTVTDLGMDCAGFLSWCWRNTICGGPGATDYSLDLNLTDEYNWIHGNVKGAWDKYFQKPKKKEAVFTTANPSGRCGDALVREGSDSGVNARHTVIVVGTVSDGGYVLIHSTSYCPTSKGTGFGGVFLAGTTEEAKNLAFAYNKKYFSNCMIDKTGAIMPNNAKVTSISNTHTEGADGKISYYLVPIKDGSLSDPEGLRNMDAYSVLEYFLGPL